VKVFEDELIDIFGGKSKLVFKCMVRWGEERRRREGRILKR
jgi:hypothetical protein